MKSQKDYVNVFDACVKKALKNEKNYRIRSMNNRHKHYVNISELSYSEQNELSYSDTYPSELFHGKLTTRLFEAVIKDELLYEALLNINPNIREIILLKYWGDLTDTQIGQALNMSQQMVSYNKRKALKTLRRFIEEMRKL